MALQTLEIGSSQDRVTDVAWLSSARVVRCWVKSRNERNPRAMLQISSQTAPNGEEGGDDVKSAWLLRPGRHTRYNGRDNAQPPREGERIAETRSQFGSQAATRLGEVGVASNRVSAQRGEYVPGPCTHRPSRHESGSHLKSVGRPQGGSGRGWGR